MLTMQAQRIDDEALLSDDISAARQRCMAMTALSTTLAIVAIIYWSINDDTRCAGCGAVCNNGVGACVLCSGACAQPACTNCTCLCVGQAGAAHI